MARFSRVCLLGFRITVVTIFGWTLWRPHLKQDITYYMICICLWHIKTWEILDFTMKFNHVQPSAEAGCHWAFVKPRCRVGLLGLEADAQTGGWLRCPRRRQLRSCVRHPCWWWLVRSYWPTLHTSNLREHHNPLISIIHGNEYSMHHIPLISPLISSLKVDASATRPGYVNWTPLHLAAVRGYTEILQVLLKAKACVGAGSLEVEDLHQLNEA